MSTYETLLARAEHGVLHLTLNRPEVRNAMSLAMVLELRQALAAAETDGQTRVIVLQCWFPVTGNLHLSTITPAGGRGQRRR